MKKVLGLSIAALLLIGLVVGGTFAYFSDTETSAGNLFTAGTIDLMVNTQNPWTDKIDATLSDLKPGMTGNAATITLHNNGTNPMDVWMIIKDVSTAAGTQTEPEIADPASPATDIDSVIHYTLTGSAPPIVIGDNFLISAGAHSVTGNAVKDSYIWIGNILAGADKVIDQTFTMDSTVANWAQGDTMSFTVEFYAQQSEGTPQPPIPGTELTGHARP